MQTKKRPMMFGGIVSVLVLLAAGGVAAVGADEPTARAVSCDTADAEGGVSAGSCVTEASARQTGPRGPRHRRRGPRGRHGLPGINGEDGARGPRHGDIVFERFKTKRMGTLWYYPRIAAVLPGRLPAGVGPERLGVALVATVDELVAAVGESHAADDWEQALAHEHRHRSGAASDAPARR